MPALALSAAPLPNCCVRRRNDSFELTHIFDRNVSRIKVDWVPSTVRWTESIDEVLSSDADIFVELVGGITPAGEWIRESVASGQVGRHGEQSF